MSHKSAIREYASVVVNMLLNFLDIGDSSVSLWSSFHELSGMGFEPLLNHEETCLTCPVPGNTSGAHITLICHVGDSPGRTGNGVRAEANDYRPGSGVIPLRHGSVSVKARLSLDQEHHPLSGKVVTGDGWTPINLEGKTSLTVALMALCFLADHPEIKHPGITLIALGPEAHPDVTLERNLGHIYRLGDGYVNEYSCGSLPDNKQTADTLAEAIFYTGLSPDLEKADEHRTGPHVKIHNGVINSGTRGEFLPISDALEVVEVLIHLFQNHVAAI